MANTILFNLFGLFEFIHIVSFLSKFTKDDLISCVYDISWVLFDFYFVASIVVSSELIRKAAGETRKLLHFMENQITNIEVAKTVNSLNI